jgi:hypothetical protein
MGEPRKPPIPWNFSRGHLLALKQANVSRNIAA